MSNKPTGREMDAWVAKHVCGWINPMGTVTGDRLWCRNNGVARIFHPTTDIAAAIEALEVTGKQWEIIKTVGLNSGRVTYRCNLCHRTLLSSGKNTTAPEAICDALWKWKQGVKDGTHG